MKKYAIFLFAMLLIPSLVRSQDRLEVKIPTAQEEAQYVWMNLKDISFFDQNNYRLSWPDGDFINGLLLKSRNHQLSGADYDSLVSEMVQKIYQKEDYQEAFQKIEEQLPFINEMISELPDSMGVVDFMNFPLYEVKLSLYGPGGSYNPQNGSLLLFATKKGDFKRYTNPAYTIIHEIVHMGIEASLIQEYNVPHTLKERIVDNFVLLYFGDRLPGYKKQEMGWENPDRYLKSKDDLEKLPEIIQQILAEEK